MHRNQCINSFDFDNNLFIYYDVESLASQQMSTIVNLDRFLSDERHSAGSQLNAKRLFVEFLKKSRSQLLMHLKSSIQSLFARQFNGLWQRCISFS